MKKRILTATIALTGIVAHAQGPDTTFVFDQQSVGNQKYGYSNHEIVTSDAITGIGYVANNGGEWYHFGPAAATLTVNGLYNAFDANINGFVGTPANPGVDYFQGLDAAKATAQEIAGSTVPLFGVLKLDNGPNQINITNAQGANVGLRTDFTNGITTTVRSVHQAGALRFLSGATYSGSVAGVVTTATADAQHVNGYVGKRGNQTFVYPVGSGGDARPLQISAPGAATDEYTVAWIAGDPTTTTDPSGTPATHPITAVGPGLGAVSPVGQWDWIAVSGTGAGLTITVSMPNMSSFGSASALRLVGWNGSQWVNLSTGGGPYATSNTENSTLTGTMIAGISAIGIGRGLIPDLTPTIVLPLNSMSVGQTRNFVVRLDELKGVATGSPISFNLEVPTGYSLSFNPATTSMVVPGAAGSPFAVSNPNWAATVQSPQEIDMTSTAPFAIGASGLTRVGFIITNVSAQPNSAGNIVVNIYADPSQTYDSVNANNIFSRIVTGF